MSLQVQKHIPKCMSCAKRDKCLCFNRYSSNIGISTRSTPYFSYVDEWGKVSRNILYPKSCQRFVREIRDSRGNFTTNIIVLS